LLAAVRVERASLVVITVDKTVQALQTAAFLRAHCPHVPIIARARDLESSSRLHDAGVTHAYPESIEASLRLGAMALQMLSVAGSEIEQVIQDVRDWDYKPVLEAEDEKST
jgi:CPA2 family monovalent cation:H+ antiporter-2